MNASSLRDTKEVHTPTRSTSPMYRACRPLPSRQSLERCLCIYERMIQMIQQKTVFTYIAVSCTLENDTDIWLSDRMYRPAWSYVYRIRGSYLWKPYPCTTFFTTHKYDLHLERNPDHVVPIRRQHAGKSTVQSARMGERDEVPQVQP